MSRVVRVTSVVVNLGPCWVVIRPLGPLQRGCVLLQCGKYPRRKRAAELRIKG